ncbi:hypothetical protein PG989_015990 [Apiospora arundinis]
MTRHGHGGQDCTRQLRAVSLEPVRVGYLQRRLLEGPKRCESSVLLEHARKDAIDPLFRGGFMDRCPKNLVVAYILALVVPAGHLLKYANDGPRELEVRLCRERILGRLSGWVICPYWLRAFARLLRFCRYLPRHLFLDSTLLGQTLFAIETQRRRRHAPVRRSFWVFYASRAWSRGCFLPLLFAVIIMYTSFVYCPVRVGRFGVLEFHGQTSEAVLRGGRII